MLETSRLFYKIGFMENHKPRPNKGLYLLPNICDSYTWIKISLFFGTKKLGRFWIFWGVMYTMACMPQSFWYPFIHHLNCVLLQVWLDLLDHSHTSPCRLTCTSSDWILFLFTRDAVSIRLSPHRLNSHHWVCSCSHLLQPNYTM
jgi:hypothetical protein